MLFSQLDRWAPPRASVLHGSKSDSWEIVRIGDVVTQVTEKIIAEEEAEYRMAGVKWYAGGVFHRETVLGKDMSARYVTPLKSDALVYNRLFAWKQSFAVVTPEHEGLFVSNEFPQFLPDTSRLLPEFLYLFCTTPSTTKLVNAASAGSAAVSRNRFKEAEFTSFKLRLPPLATQQAIVDHWKATQKKCAAALRAADEEEETFNVEFVKKLGLNASKKVSTARAFSLQWTQIERWGVDGLRNAAESLDLAKGFYPVSLLADLAEMVQYGTSTKANTEGRGTPVLRMNNIHEGVLRLHSIKHIYLPAKERESLLLKDGDILFNRTNSKELVGKCGVFHEPDEYVYASYLIRVRTKPDVADPDYVAFVINGTIGRQQIDSMSRQIIGMTNVNSQELRSLRIPLPPLLIQKQLVAEITATRAKIAAERAAAKKLAADTAREVEEMILGHLPVPTSS